ncbi:fumarylacetoacetate hydrolase [Xylophilus rhododendri]|uniref:Fumarylacetoacetate hydrolase n=1 Tax=Xylophilus rhododendri TaxID=2697032 RepID=A0A857J7G3_9BURK|nr:fumarylacetoacetate hydrolase family protein [Xylophilus rhododendri]QHI99183.1 fumarylacetoacetate hydrolase [Xylophilus rhododendri]
MKLATYQDGSRDGQLVLVSRDLASAHYATGVASRLQAVLDDWNFLSPQLQDLYDELNAGRARHAFPFDPRHCMAPLPRAYGHFEGGGFAQAQAMLQAAAGTDAAAPSEPRMARLGGGELLGATEYLRLPRGGLEADFEAGLAVVTGDIPAGCTAERAIEGIRLVLLANGLALRGPGEEAAAFDARPATAFSPVAVTVDELGPAWSGGRLNGTLQTVWNGRKVGLNEAGPEMDFHFGQLIARVARNGRLRAGTLVGCGPVSNKAVPREGAREGRRAAKAAAAAAALEWPRGYACIADKRAMETLQDGSAKTGWLQPHDTIRIEMKGRDGLSIFGAIEQEVTVGGSTAVAAG